MEKVSLPKPVLTRSVHRVDVWQRLTAAIVLAGIFAFTVVQWPSVFQESTSSVVPINAHEILDKCRLLDIKPSPPPDFNLRKQSDRFVEGTKAVLIQNATIWTGRMEGLEEIKGDILLDGGIVKAVGVVEQNMLAGLDDLVKLNAHGAWVSPGIVDLHSHISAGSAPSLRGASDTNSRKGPILPWLRILDGLNTHDDAHLLSISGGVTTVLALPGSANAIGGQGAVIKLRPTAERTPTSMLLENPYSANRSEYDPRAATRWRQMKHACGENPDRVYSGTRMDTTWAFRQAYNKAREIKTQQDEYCSKAVAGKWTGLGEFPEDYQWEALVDVLRNKVKVHNHCYETVDLDDMVRITNEFKFSIAAFHHAHETYLVPGTLKAAYGHPPAIALFATSARYKREAYRGSEFAPKILAENDLQVVMKSDHPVLNSRHLIYEAQQAHYFGLPHNLALASVTTTPAQVLGQDHRVGFIKPGYDADIVLWDSHPLAIGATPKQVWIDGIPQIKSPHSITKPATSQRVPETPNFDDEAKDAVEYDGVPPLIPHASTEGAVSFLNVSRVFVRNKGEVIQLFSSSSTDSVVVVRNGEVRCFEHQKYRCISQTGGPGQYDVNLMGGSISPGLVAFGSPLGLEEIRSESSTIDGIVVDSLVGEVPKILGGSNAIIKASDGLQFQTRHALLAYRSGVTVGVVSPQSVGLVSGLGVAFSTGAEHKLKKGALVQDITAVHVGIYHSGVPSISTQITALRNLLHGKAKGALGHAFSLVTKGKIPLVIRAHDADTIASLIKLKKEIESHHGHSLRFTLVGAIEAHILADELAEADIGVVLAPVRPFPSSWEMRRIMPGPPLSETDAVSYLMAHNVTVGLGIRESNEARNIRFDAAWATLSAAGKLSEAEGIALASSNLEKLVGVDAKGRYGYEYGDLIATQGGGLLDMSSKVIAVVSSRMGKVDIISERGVSPHKNY